MTDLIDFLRARLDEDAEWANFTPPSHYHEGESVTPDDRDRVLRDVETKRRIIQRCEMAEEPPTHNLELIMSAHVLSLLALPYSDHPDYREEWRL